ncbi:MAG: histidine kinase [Tannerellaceae bacterium]|nr:histidine kinase [Tannerellaceae bacterium]
MVDRFLKNSHIIESFFIGNYRWLRHLFLLVVALVVVADMYDTGTGGLDTTPVVYWICFLNLVPVYINVYWLTPKLLLKNRIITYILSVVVIVSFVLLTIIYLQLFVNHFELDEEAGEFVEVAFWLNISSGIVTMFLLVAGSTAVVLIQQWMRYNKHINELRKITLKAELEQLKNQINPHFLFNMLNNANVLVKENPAQAAKVLVKLDDLLRYQFAGTSQEKVFLKDDIRFLEDFLNLEKIRRDNFEFSIRQEGEIGNIQIPSLLFIPFVENAVKHNNDNKRLSYVHLYFKLKEDMLSFVCINSKSQEQQAGKERPGGLGLANIRRRLELIYGNNHVLKMRENEITYTVILQIKI